MADEAERCEVCGLEWEDHGAMPHDFEPALAPAEKALRSLREIIREAHPYVFAARCDDPLSTKRITLANARRLDALLERMQAAMDEPGASGGKVH